MQKWNEEFKLPDGLYSLHNIHKYFQYIKEKYELRNNVISPLKNYVN